jgi:UV DNA damage repair endonuclease
MEREFAKIGDIARRDDVRLSFHPGQFCCLVSENPGIVQNSIEEFEYHVDMARLMGFGKTFQDFKINVHLSGKRGVEGFNEVYTRLSPEARNTITLENDEYQAGLDVVLKLKDKVAIVLDLHHNWINTGEYISADDDRIKMIIESWCRDGVERRPVIHYSQSREDVLIDHDPMVQPNMTTLLESGYKKAKLRAHSDSMWNTKTNQWAKSHFEWADCMVEAKNKNIAVDHLIKQLKSSDI